MSKTTEFTQAQIVAIEGDETVKEHLKKFNKLMTNMFNRFVKDLKERYETVETIGKGGMKTKYILGTKREVLAEREDNRMNNGAWSISYTKNMDIMVVSALEQDLVTETAQVLSKWCLDFGLITQKMFELLPSKFNEHYREQCLQELKVNNIICEGEDRILNDFIYEIKNLQNQLAGTLNRMQKANIIEYFPVYKGFIEEDDKTINLHENTVKKISSLQRNLMEQFDVNEWYLKTYYNSRKSREYCKEWKENLAKITDENGEVIGLSYWYTTYAIILKATKKKIIRYLEKYNKEAIEQFKKGEDLFLNKNEETFHKARYDYVVKEARKREANFLSEKTKIVELNESVNEIYGETTKEVRYFNKRHEFTYDENYYALYFNRLYAQRIQELQEYYGHTLK
ncbi:hypothetical protein [Peribacillus sp. NPDC097225]|uniref:hypothetical protein n=1 Tax=Peribacillus sp. NPDC097225 TaxID=3364400 RepID=UPI003830555A